MGWFGVFEFLWWWLFKWHKMGLDLGNLMGFGGDEEESHGSFGGNGERGEENR